MEVPLGLRVLEEIAKKFGLTGLVLRHYKSQPTYDGDFDLILLSEQEMKGPITVDLIKDPKFLMIYEYEPLGVYVLVRKKLEETK